MVFRGVAGELEAPQPPGHISIGSDIGITGTGGIGEIGTVDAEAVTCVLHVALPAVFDTPIE